MEKTVIGKLLEKIGEFFGRIFTASKEVYADVSPEIKEALKKGSEIIQVINENLDNTPDFIFEIIKNKYPEVTEEKLREVISKAGNAINTIDNNIDNDIIITIGNIQKALANNKQKDGAMWAAISSTLAKLIAVFLAPKGTKWATIETLMEYVYRAFIKK